MSETHPGAEHRSPEDITLVLDIANSINWSKVDEGWDDLSIGVGTAVGRAYSWYEGITPDFKLHHYHIFHAKVDTVNGPIASLSVEHTQTDYSQPAGPFPILIWEYALNLRSGEFTVTGERTDTEEFDKMVSDEAAQTNDLEAVKERHDFLEALKALGLTKPAADDWDTFVALLRKAAEVSRLPQQPTVDTTVLQAPLPSEIARRHRTISLQRLLRWLMFGKEREVN